MTFSKAIAYPVMLFAGVGACSCVVAFVLSSFSAYALSKDRLTLLFAGVFIVWFPTVILMHGLTRDFKQRDLWKAALRGCPSWMRACMWLFVVGVAALTFLPVAWQGRPNGQVFILFPSIFYAVSFCTMYSLIHVDRLDAGRRCLNGHAISPLSKFCEECGAPAAENVTKLGMPQ